VALWAAGLVSGGFALGGRGVDGHIESEGAQLAEVTADLAVVGGVVVVV